MVRIATPRSDTDGWREYEVTATDDDDDDVYYYIRWRLKLEGETE